MGSECGCLPGPRRKIVKKWRLQPGKMSWSTSIKAASSTTRLKDSLAGTSPYPMDRADPVKLDEVETEKTPPLKSAVQLLDRQQAFA